MATTPTTPGMGYEEALYRGAAMSCLRRLKDANKGLTIFHGTYQLPGGVEVFCNVCGNKEDVYVRVPRPVAPDLAADDVLTTGFICHPRTADYYQKYQFMQDFPPSNTVAGGFDTSVWPAKELTTNYVYPMVDADNASYRITIWADKDKTETEFLGVSSEYGNFYLKRPEKAEDVISWKGNPSRQVAIYPEYHFIDGLDGTIENPVFGTWIYSGGKKFLRGPKCNKYTNVITGFSNQYALILGCGYCNNRIVGICGYSDDDGYYFGAFVYVGGEWKTLAKAKQLKYPYSGLNWSFSEDGLLAVCTDGSILKIVDNVDIDKLQGTFTLVQDTDKNVNGLEDIRDVVESYSVDKTSYFDSKYSVDFNGQREQNFFGYYKDRLLSLNTEIVECKLAYNKTKTDKTIEAVFVTTNKCTWETYGPIKMVCNDDNCVSATMIYDSIDGSLRCLAPLTNSSGVVIVGSYDYGYRPICTSTTSLEDGSLSTSTTDVGAWTTGVATPPINQGYFKCTTYSCGPEGVGGCPVGYCVNTASNCTNNSMPQGMTCTRSGSTMTCTYPTAACHDTYISTWICL